MFTEIQRISNLEPQKCELFHKLQFQGTMKTLLKTWGDLYATFSRLAAMVATVQGNLVCEELCALLLQGLQELPQVSVKPPSYFHLLF